MGTSSGARISSATPEKNVQQSLHDYILPSRYLPVSLSLEVRDHLVEQIHQIDLFPQALGLEIGDDLEEVVEQLLLVKPARS